ncbi:Pectinacetylesterase-domain-containing protein [Pelagophyceae sp. CCMP2097]|nr:Pectinacetylesterase-domain-containing protein [Pelagophyceae sp. CCMP2097]
MGLWSLPASAAGLLALAGLPLGSGAALDLFWLSQPTAVCNDGSPAAYYYRAATALPQTYLVYLQGGGWCWDAASCAAREAWRKTSDGLSPQVTIGGIFDEAHSAVAGAHVIFVPYCTSDAFMGDVAASPDSLGMHFRGHRVVEAVFANLVAKRGLGASSGQTVIFGGGSAGARGAMVHLDGISDLVASTARRPEHVIGFLDSPLWVDAPALDPNKASLAETVQMVQKIANVTQLGAACAAAHEADTSWKCLLGEYRMPYVKSPYVLIASQDDSYQLSYNLGHFPNASNAAEAAYTAEFAAATAQLVGSLPPFGLRAAATVFSQRCYDHSTSQTPRFYQESVGGFTMNDALVDVLDAARAGEAPRRFIDDCAGFDCGAGCTHASRTAATPEPARVPPALYAAAAAARRSIGALCALVGLGLFAGRVLMQCRRRQTRRKRKAEAPSVAWLALPKDEDELA